MKKGFNENLGQILRDAREKIGLTLQEVAKLMEFKNYQTLSSIENGTRQIKAAELAKLAKVYYKDISYFLNPQQKEHPTLILWRSSEENEKMKVKEQEFLKYCFNYSDLEKRLGLEHKFKLLLCDADNYSTEDFSFAKVHELAKNYSDLMRLGPRPALVLQKVLEQKHNIKIVFLELEESGSAASAIGDFGAAILINSSEAPWRRNYDLAHELFHIITWKIFKNEKVHIIKDEKSLLEKWADAFASNLLLPAEEVIDECKSRVQDNKISEIDLVGIAKEFGVSTQALLWRLVRLNMLSEKDVKEAIEGGMIKEADRQERTSEDWGEQPLAISERYVNLLFKAYQKGHISRGKVAEYLNVERNQVGKKLREYGYDEEQVYERELAVA